LAKPNYIDRPPRIQPELPSGEYEIPAPPEKKEDTNEILMQVAMPLITILGYVFVAVFSKGNNMIMMIPMAIAVVGAVFLAMYANRDAKNKREAAAAAYRQRLVELRKEMEGAHEIQRIYYHYNYPEPEISLRMAADLGRDTSHKLEDIRSGSRLWERRPTDQDFACLRLGTGTLPSTVIYKLSKIENWDDPVIRDAMRLSEDSQFVTDVPITIPLRRNQPKGKKEEEEKAPPTRYSIGIAGNHPGGVYDFIRGALVDFTAYHSPTDTRLYVVGSYEARQHWRWAFSLPHTKEAQVETLCFEDDQEKKGEKEQDRVALFWKNLRNILERRKVRLMDQESGADVTLPFLLVVIDAMAPLPEWSALRDLESEAAVSLLLQEGERLGAAVIFLMPERSKIPSGCQAVIETDVAPEEGGKAVFRYGEVGVNTPRYVGTADLIRSQDLVRDFAKMLEPLVMRMSYGADLAPSVTLLEMLGVSSMDDLNRLVEGSWHGSVLPPKSDWLSVHVGLLAGNEPRKLTFSAKADGVHGLVAGSTGSGKSELLMTLIIGLALNYDPSVVNFVLVDYKGGAAFEPFRTLPHCVDIVTNLEGSATARMFASVKAELDRRQRLNTYTDSKDIVHYRKKGLHTEKNAPPYPFLFIIIDEFAEMIAGNAEFKSQLESITRLGRALGVHLILAAQRPIGVTDQMRANIKFRICLRVETPDDSRELLRRADSAYLPPGIPGRGYLQVGNENIELIQTAYTGGDYRGPQEAVSPNVIWLNRPKKAVAQKAAEPPKLYDVIVSSLADRARTEESNRQWRPWPAFLPRKLYLQSPVDQAYMSENDIAIIRASGGLADSGEETQPEVEGDASTRAAQPLALNAAITPWVSGIIQWKGIDWLQTAMRPVIGIIDNPYDARQLPLVVNFPVGHAVLFGASGWGKTTFVRTLITCLVDTHSPEELNVYILDLGGRNLIVFKELPHVGAVITSDEDERIQRLLRKLASILEKRQSVLSDAGATDIYAYNNKHTETILPAILVVIDNFAEFKENHENLLDPLTALVRDSRAYGIHFLVTADLPNALTGKLFNLFTERMTLKLSDAAEYVEVVGRGVPDMGNIPGRGFIRQGNMPLEFQVALPVRVDDEDSAKQIDEAEKLKRAFIRTSQFWDGAWKGEPPATIDTLPVRVSLEKTLQTVTGRPAGRLLAVLGIDDLSLAPYLMDFQRQGPHFVIVGPPNSGKTTSLRSLALSLAYAYPPDQLMMALIDMGRKFIDYGGKRSLSMLPHVVQTVTKVEQLPDFAANLKYECETFEGNPAHKRIFVLIDNYDSFSDDAARKNSDLLEQLGILAREYGTAGLYFVISTSVSSMIGGEDLKKQIYSSSFGMGLLTGDAVERLNGRVPRSLSDVELPLGRGFIVKSGRTSMVQVATPYSSDDNIESSLDNWVDLICGTHPEPQATWSRPPSADGSPAAPDEIRSMDGGLVYFQAAAPQEDVETIKANLRSQGIGDDLLNLLTDEEVFSMASTYAAMQMAEASASEAVPEAPGTAPAADANASLN